MNLRGKVSSGSPCAKAKQKGAVMIHYQNRWAVVTGALQSHMGPCAMMDRMGLGVVYHVAKVIGETTANTQALDSGRYVDEHFIQKCRLGVASGQGFYSYPNPAFAQPGFITAAGGATQKGTQTPAQSRCQSQPKGENHEPIQLCS
jgi:3-hydroxyacyl-CoA dehydrogenase